MAIAQSGTAISVPQAEAPSRYRFVIAGLLLLAHLSLGLNFFGVASILPLVIEDYGITRTTASLLVALPVLIKAFIGLPGSIITGKFGVERTFAMSWFIMGALTFSAFAPNFTTMLVLRLAYGIGAGLMMPAIGPLVMKWFPIKEIPIINTLLLIVISLGIAISISLAVPLTNLMAWQTVLSLFGVVGLIGAVAWLFFGRVQPDSQDAEPGFNLQEVWQVLRNRTIFLLVVGDALVFIQYAALTSWLPTYFNEFRSMTLEQAGYITGLLPTIGIFAVLVGGFLTYKFKAQKLFFIIPGILVGLGGLGSFLLSNHTAISISVIMVGIGTWVYQPILLTLPMQLPWMTPKKVAYVWGASLTIAGFGMFLSPIVVGASRDIFGTFVPGFLIWSVLAWALLLTGILLPKRESDS